MTIGSHGSAQGRFDQPSAVAMLEGRLYVVDKKNDRVQAFTAGGDFVRSFGQGHLLHPTDAAFLRQQTDNGQAWRLLVCDAGHDRIAVFDTSGAFVDSMAQDLGLQKPKSVCVDPWGDIYVADVQNNRVVVLNQYGDRQLAFGTEGTGPGRFRKPKGLAVSPDGQYLYVSDSRNNRVQRFRMTFAAPGGKGQASGQDKVASAAPRYVFSLGQNNPNPFKRATVITYQLPKQDHVLLSIYNINGQLVKTMVSRAQDPGVYSVAWDGKDLRCNEVASACTFIAWRQAAKSIPRK